MAEILFVRKYLYYEKNQTIIQTNVPWIVKVITFDIFPNLFASSSCKNMNTIFMLATKVFNNLWKQFFIFCAIHVLVHLKLAITSPL